MLRYLKPLTDLTQTPSYDQPLTRKYIFEALADMMECAAFEGKEIAPYFEGNETWLS